MKTLFFAAALTAATTGAALAASDDGAQFPVGLFTFAILAVIYFLPAFIASKRNHRQTTAIALLNLFLGWTFVGWVAALVWAVSN
jgi:Superinfection immunity protein